LHSLIEKAQTGKQESALIDIEKFWWATLAGIVRLEVQGPERTRIRTRKQHGVEHGASCVKTLDYMGKLD
jgi:hypothetical protein